MVIHSLKELCRSFGIGRKTRKPSRRGRPSRLGRVHLKVECLEDRFAPAGLVVTSASDPTILTAGTLRYAVNQANTDAADGISDTISFATTKMGTSVVTLQQGDLELRAGTGTTTIDGGGQVSISGGTKSGVFVVDSGADAVLTGLTIENGQALQGAGIDNAGKITVSDTTIANNNASGLSDGTGSGGGIYNTGTATLTDVTVANNHASGFLGSEGGGIYNAGTATLTNVTVANNDASEGPLQFGGVQYYSYGGGIYNAGLLALTATTVSANTAVDAGGIYNDNSLTLTNTIVAGNSAGTDPDIDGYAVATSAYNLIGNGNAAPKRSQPQSSGHKQRRDQCAAGPAGQLRWDPRRPWPCCPAVQPIGKGEAIAGVSTDQRGQAVASPPCIGAYQTGVVAKIVVRVTGTATADSPYTITVTAVPAPGSLPGRLQQHPRHAQRHRRFESPFFRRPPSP